MEDNKNKIDTGDNTEVANNDVNSNKNSDSQTLTLNNKTIVIKHNSASIAFLVASIITLFLAFFQKIIALILGIFLLFAMIVKFLKLQNSKKENLEDDFCEKILSKAKAKFFVSFGIVVVALICSGIFCITQNASNTNGVNGSISEQSQASKSSGENSGKSNSVQTSTSQEGTSSVLSSAQQSSQAASSNAISMSQQQALKKAKSYLKTTAFSYSGLIKQLEYEKFSTEDATYGADNCGANWNEQAVLKAKSYLKNMSFSKDSLSEQLKYEGFTGEQASYAVAQVYN